MVWGGLNYNWHVEEIPEIKGTRTAGYESRMAGERLRLSYVDGGLPPGLICSIRRER
jgi:hypothetical protein